MLCKLLELPGIGLRQAANAAMSCATPQSSVAAYDKWMWYQQQLQHTLGVLGWPARKVHNATQISVTTTTE